MAESKHIPKNLRDIMLILMCTTTLLMVGAALILPNFPPVERNVPIVGIVVCAALQLAFIAAWYYRSRMESVGRLFDAAPLAATLSPAPAAEPDLSNLFGNTRWLDLSPEFRNRIAGHLVSSVSELRRHAVHIMSSLSDSPIAPLDCWPVLNCSKLRFAAAEALLREWIDCVGSAPQLTEDQLIHLLFPVETEREEDRPRIRMLPVPYPEVSPTPPTPPPLGKLEQTIERWNEMVKDAILDRPGEDEENEFSSPDEDQPLGPLDRGQFTEALQQQFAAVAEHIADTIATPATDFELAKTEDEVGRFLHEFRWDALALAIDLRSTGTVPEPPATSPRCSPPPRPPRHSDAWAKKYRRMRALG
jgi:hypothetical protein